ncbi:unnamed protein product [Caenorhabditis bovis]|uniref:NADAR domain-containing protein n=1 Tax=Caenorhabditis bovis TaxID=2654633 RepID=A0A8S1E884_9PELO|nr:unnamed protein product [Caenorhabditis bovis]
MGTRWIRTRTRSGENRDFTLFFRKVSPFSNHFPVNFNSDESLNYSNNVEFCCNEQFYMFNKASLFGDERAMREILGSKNPKEMKKLAGAHSIANWDERIWNSHKDDVMRKGSMAKYSSAAHLRFALFLTTGSELLECSPFDRYWGIGKEINEAIGCLPDGIAGKNRLGMILDEIRETMWNDERYRNEREFIEKRLAADSEYAMKTIAKLDLIYKDQAAQRFALHRRWPVVIKHCETDSEGVVLIPEWARSPQITMASLSICPSPPVYCDFEMCSKMTNTSSTPAKIIISRRLASRLSIPESLGVPIDEAQAEVGVEVPNMVEDGRYRGNEGLEGTVVKDPGGGRGDVIRVRAAPEATRRSDAHHRADRSMSPSNNREKTSESRKMNRRERRAAEREKQLGKDSRNVLEDEKGAVAKEMDNGKMMR